MTKLERLNRFITKGNKVHNNFYDYSVTEYVKSTEKLKIKCPVHGIFTQRVAEHLRGYGCNKCGIERMAKTKRKRLNEFIADSISIHGLKYGYDEVNYINNNTKVAIICYKHGKFYQEPKSHIRGCGCPKCRAEYMNTLAYGFWSKEKFINFYKNQLTTLYIVKLNSNDEEFIKVGITGGKVKDRMKTIPYNYELLYSMKDSPKNVWEKENLYHNLLVDYKFVPNIKFQGRSECFNLKALEVLALTKGIKVE